MEEVIKETRARSAEKTILIVEDDMTLRLLWQQIIKKLSVPVELEWATSEGAAERAITEKQRHGDNFDVVVCDIFLSGNKTGIDLWQSHRNDPTEFVFTSGVSGKKFKELFDDHEVDHLFIAKPLNPRVCINILNDILKKKTTADGQLTTRALTAKAADF